MANNRYSFPTTIEGFTNVYEDSGKFNNRGFGFTIPDAIVELMETDREELLVWAKSKAPNPNRCEVAMTKWDESGAVRYSYGGETKRTEPVFVDSVGNPVGKEVLKSLRAGTKVNIICQQSPYVFGSKVGTKFIVPGIQIVELATGNGAVDSGSMSASDVASMFGTVEGYKADEPAVRPADGVVGDGQAYNF